MIADLETRDLGSMGATNHTAASPRTTVWRDQHIIDATNLSNRGEGMERAAYAV